MSIRVLEAAKLSLASSARALVQCAVILGVFGLLILDWRSPIGIYLPSSNLNELVFCAGVALTPVLLVVAARSLGPIVRGLFWAIAVALAMFAVLVLWWDGSWLISKMRRGAEESLVRSIPTPYGRVSAYQLETPFSGIIAHLRLERTLVPGVVLSRDLAFVNGPEIEHLALQTPDSLCLSFRPDSQQVMELQTTLALHPLLTWVEPSWIDDMSAHPVVGDAACHQALP